MNQTLATKSPEDRQVTAPTRPAEPFLAPFSSPWFLFTLVALSALLLLFFNRFDGIDRAVSSWFFVAEECGADSAAVVCGSFPAADSVALNVVRDILHYLPATVAVLLALAAIAARWLDRPGGRRFASAVTVMVASVLISAVLLVDAILKTAVGRPRPHATDIFGGKLPFVPAGQISDYCRSNCSFVSGEAAGIFWLVCLAPLLPSALRVPYLVLSLAVATFTAGLRVSFGAHYLSDVVMAGMLTLTVFALLATVAARRQQAL